MEGKQAILTLMATLLVATTFYLKSDYSFILNEEDTMRQSFEAWKSEYQKSYGAAQNDYRFQVYKQNFRYIQEQNRLDLSYTLGPNEYMDHTEEEFQSKFTGFMP